jgi:hypothetical protein
MQNIDYIVYPIPLTDIHSLGRRLGRRHLELLSTRQPCLIRGPVCAVQSVAYRGFEKRDLLSLPSPYLPLLLMHHSIFPSLPSPCPSFSFLLPSISPFNGGPGYYPRGNNFKIADARRGDLAQSVDQTLLSDAVNFRQCNKL